MDGYLSPLTALLPTLLLIYALRPLAHHVGLVDPRGSLGCPHGPVPLVGGLAMFCGFSFAVFALGVELLSLRSFFGAAALLLVVGVFDDFRGLSSRLRLCAQVAAILLMTCWGGVVLRDLGDIGSGGSTLVLGGWAVGFTVFGAVGVINAFNMSDGMDGLAGGLGCIAVLGLCYLAWQGGAHDAHRSLLLLLAALCAFLTFNVRLPWRSRSLAFMGDAGSMFLGFALAWYFVELSQGPRRVMSPVTALWLLMVPLYDTVWLIFKRCSTLRSPFDGDRRHLHNLLLRRGLGPAKSVLVIWGLAAAGAMVGIGAELFAIPDGVMFRAFLVGFALYCLLMAWAWQRIQALPRAEQDTQASSADAL